MTENKDLKRLVRSRMKKTGESYTTARARLIRKQKTVTDTAAKVDFAAVAAMSDDAVRAKTGRTWRQWVRLLDDQGARSLAHKEIAAHLRKALGLSPWWSQSVTVGYERIIGRRQVGQQCSGTFQASKSKTFRVPLATLYKAWSVKRTRHRWLPGINLDIRTSTREKSMRITWPDGTSVEAWFTAKSKDKSMVAIQHRKLESKTDIARVKTFWSEHLDRLAELLASGVESAARPG